MIVITGSESFVGKELIIQCKKKGIDCIGIDLLDKNQLDYQYHNLDLRSPELEKIIPEKLDCVVHLAAMSNDTTCKENVSKCFDVNVMGTMNLINACKKKKVKQFIFASSEWVYGDFEEGEEKDENAIIDITKISSEYALSKLISEINLRHEYEKGFCPVTILRFGIIYGPRKNNWSAVEAVMSQVKNNSEVSIGSNKNGRRFIHVSDIVHGIICSIGNSEFNTLNLTGNKIITIENIIQESQNILEKTVKIKETNPTKISVRNPSNQKAKNILGWSPKIDINTGLRTLVDFI